MKTSTEVIEKMPKNLKGRVYLPSFDPTNMPLGELLNVMKILFRDVWGEIIIYSFVYGS